MTHKHRLTQQFSHNGTRLERTAWRDEQISARHRAWGFDCPAVDLDFLAVEYNVGKPVALIEYKYHKAATVDLQHATYRALADLANAYPLPFLIVRYWREPWAFRVQIGNEAALHWFNDGETLSEFNYVKRLYLMRRAKVTAELHAKLDKTLPEDLTK